MHYVVFDVEATGLNKLLTPLSKPTSVQKMGSEIIQMGGLFLDDEMRPLKGFCHYCDCLAAHSEAKAFSVHQIPLEEIRTNLSGVFVEEVIVTWLPEFYDDDIVFIGYNTGFDLAMVSQGVRDLPVKFKLPKRVAARIPPNGRFFVDVMDYLGPRKVKLASFEGILADDRSRFLYTYSKSLPIESNRQDLFRDSWARAHNSFYDSLNTYLLYMTRVWKQKIVRGGARGN